MSKFKGLTEQETYISLAETLDFGRWVSNTTGYYFNHEIGIWVAIFDDKDLTDSEIWDEFRKSKNKTNEQ